MKRLFSSSSLSAIRVVSSAYLKLLIFLLTILIPACASSSPAFKQGDYIQPWRTPFLTWNQFIFPCPFLTVASWPAYRFVRRQVRWSAIPNLKDFPQFVVIHTVKSFSIVNEAKVDVFFWNSLAFSMIQRMLAIWLLVPLPFLNPAWTYWSSQFMSCWNLPWMILNMILLKRQNGCLRSSYK